MDRSSVGDILRACFPALDLAARETDFVISTSDLYLGNFGFLFAVDVFVVISLVSLFLGL